MDWRKLVARPDIDLVSIAAPGNLHKEIAIEAARCGKHILCEKPLANNLADAEEMLAAAQKAKVRTCCGFSYRSSPAQAYAKQLVDEGRIGRIYHVYARYAQDWPSDPDFPDGVAVRQVVGRLGLVGRYLRHSIDAARFITGLEVTEVVGQLATLIPERPTQAPRTPTGRRARLRWTTWPNSSASSATGRRACFEATRFAIGRKNHNCIEVNGDRGSVYWDFEDQNYLHFYDKTRPVAEQGFVKINVTHDSHPYGGGPWPQGHGIGYADTFVIEIANFLRAIANGEPFGPTSPTAWPASGCWMRSNARPTSGNGSRCNVSGARSRHWMPCPRLPCAIFPGG